MKVYQDYQGWDLTDMLWQGGEQNYQTIKEQGKIEEFEYLIEECYPDGIELTTLNDILWFDFDWVCEQLGIEENEGE